jgi:hypothetical protein
MSSDQLSFWANVSLGKCRVCRSTSVPPHLVKKTCTISVTSSADGRRRNGIDTYKCWSTIQAHYKNVKRTVMLIYLEDQRDCIQANYKNVKRTVVLIYLERLHTSTLKNVKRIPTRGNLFLPDRLLV